MGSNGKKVCMKRRFKMLMSCMNAQLKKMGVAGSVCHQLCHHTVAPLTKGIREKKWTFWVQTVKAETVNNCCFAGLCTKVSICGPKTWMTAICTSVHVCHVLIDYLHCCTELKFTVQQLSLRKCLTCLQSTTSRLQLWQTSLELV